MEYREKYIALLEEENTWLKQRNAELEASLQDTKKDLYTAITRWDEAINKLNDVYTEMYMNKLNSIN